MSYYEAFRLYLNGPESVKDSVFLAVAFFFMAVIVSVIIAAVGGSEEE